MLELLLHEVVFGATFRVPVVSLGGVGLLVSLLLWGVVRLRRQSDITLRGLRGVSRHLQALGPLLDQIRTTCAKEHRGELRGMLPGLWHCGLDDDGYRRLDAVLSREPLLRCGP